MRRFVTFFFLVFLTIPFGVSLSGCSKGTATVYCNGADSGPIVGQLYNITLQPQLYGISLNQGEMGQVTSPTAKDCKGSSVSTSGFQYGVFLPSGQPDITVADVNPTTGHLCAGTWNRNSGAGIADYTTCIPTGKSGTVYVTASSGGVTSNSVPIYVHPVVTNVVLGAPSVDCLNDPATNCSPATANSLATASGQQASCTVLANGCCAQPIAISSATPYSGNSCLSQNQTGQLAARVYAGAGNTLQNISCLAGHLSYTPQTAAIVNIDQNGVATAAAPGSTLIVSNLSNASSSAGFFSTCPPVNIALTVPTGANSSTTNATVNQNFAQPISAIVTDKNGTTLTGINLQYVSTSQKTLPNTTTATITPTFPGAASVTAMCVPSTCNPSPFNAIGLYGNGLQVASNPVNITTPGTNSTYLYIASTQSFYIVPIDFTTGTLGSPVRLPYLPNSIAISNDGAFLYLGSATEFMEVNAATNTLTHEDPTIPGYVLGVSPDGATVVIADTFHQLVYLVSTTGSVSTQYGLVSTNVANLHATFSPDSSTVYITDGNQLLVHSSSTGWASLTGATNPGLTTPVTDAAVTVPSLGAFFAGATTTARGTCPITTVTTVNGQPTTSNLFYPSAGVTGPTTDRIAATNDGLHMLGATVTPTATLTDIAINSLNTTNSANPGQCPPAGTGLTFATTPVLTTVIPGLTATAITGVIPATDSSVAFVTYTGSGGVLPLYQPSASGPGTLSSVTLATASGSPAPVAPVTGVFSSDNTTFYVGTSGDNLVHILTRNTNGTFQDATPPIAPKLTDANGNVVVPNLLAQRPRKQS
ncbi:MAG: hypothetical protein KGK08_01760 [Acidobacteriota bacterium]|nr:hypothetical protein [Acidobacteriota bacterium]